MIIKAFDIVVDPGFGNAKLLIDRKYIIKKVLKRINENARRNITRPS